jgi:hypothetical protein
METFILTDCLYGIVSEFGTGNHGSPFKRMVLGAQEVSFRHLVSVARHDHLIRLDLSTCLWLVETITQDANHRS